MKKVTMLIAVLALAGCAKQTPTETIIGQHVHNADEIIDYAQNNMGTDPDTIMLINGLKDCRTGLLSAEQSYKAEIATCEAKTNYWRLAAFGLGILLLLGIFAKIKRII